MGLKQALHEYGGWNSPRTSCEKLAEWFQQDQLIGNEYEDCSLYHNYYVESTYEDFSHSEFFVQDERGFSVILSGMVKEIGEDNIKLKTQV
jgi:hypothetical protein